MGSGRGDRNQVNNLGHDGVRDSLLQWGPVVVTGIRSGSFTAHVATVYTLQWGPVVVTGIRSTGARGTSSGAGFNGVRSW